MREGGGYEVGGRGQSCVRGEGYVCEVRVEGCER